MIVGMAFSDQEAVIQAFPHYQALEQKLLTLGGEELVYMPSDAGFVTYLQEHGQTFSAEGLRKVRGEPSSCHDNVIAQWTRHKRTYRMVHGYGLSDDGLWRQHSWLLDTEGRVVETTVPRILYYGIILEGAMAEWFREE